MEYEYGKKGQGNQIDCSGTVTYTLNEMGFEVPAMTADQIHDELTVPTDNQSSGTLNFYDWNKDGVYDHVTINTGNGQMIHASEHENAVVEKSQTYLKPPDDVRQLNWDNLNGKSSGNSSPSGEGGIGPLPETGGGGTIELLLP